MAFTYDLSSTDATDLLVSKVRFLIPDNVESTKELEDAEIEYMLSETGNHVLATAIKCCKWLARKYGKLFSFSDAGFKADLAQRSDTFAKRAEELALDLDGGISTVDLDREDGFSDVADENGEYTRRKTVYVI